MRLVRAFIVLLLTVATTIVFAGGTQEEKTQQETMELTYSTAAHQTVQIRGRAIEQFADEIYEKTNGQVKINVYYDQSLFAQDAELDAIMTGNLDMANTSSMSFLGEYMPSLNMFDTLYIFNTLDQANAFFSSDRWAQVADEYAKKTGVRVLGVYYNGVLGMNLRMDKRIANRADLKDIKLRVPNTPTYIAAGAALGGNPVPLAWSEVYVGLQTGTVDAQQNGISAVIDNSLDEVTKSFSATNQNFSMLWFGINEKKWQSMSPELQQIFKEATKHSVEYNAQEFAKAERDGAALLRSRGMSIYTLTPEEQASYKKEVMDYYFAHNDTSTWDMDLYNYIQNMSY